MEMTKLSCEKFLAELASKAPTPGGGGTAAYALRHPGVFSSACPMSGLLDMFPGRRSYDSAFQQLSLIHI